MLGLGIYGFSAILMKYGAWATYYKGVFVTTGLFLIMVNMCWMIYRYLPVLGVRILGVVSRESLMMYLIHVPIITFLIQPLLTRATDKPLTAPVTILCSIIYCMAILFLSMLITPVINLTARPFNRIISSILLKESAFTGKE